MATQQRPTPIPWPLSSFPGASGQESAGRLINCYAEPLGDPGKPTGPAPQVWRRSPGFSLHANMGQNGYRGGLVVGNLSYETFSGNASTVDSSGNVTSLGAFPGTKKVSIARNQAASPNVVAVDLDNGAYVLSGGGAPAAYNGGGNLPQPNSVSFQDGYFFFTIGDGRVFASGINALTQNALTFTTIASKASGLLYRGIPYAGIMLFFTSASCEFWQDTAQPSPGFPYSRQSVIDFGLVQPNAIAGFEDGFSDLLWVAQDFGVYRMPSTTLFPYKVSSPDLDRLIEAQVRAGNAVEAGCYIFAGRKIWTISSPAWTWEINLSTQKWNERWSLLANGSFGRWRGTSGHPAFGKWLLGDQQSQNLVWLDNTNYTENGAVLLMRMESGPVDDFPNQIRIARADFDFVMGVGQAVGSISMTVLGAVSGNLGVVRLTVNNTAGVANLDTVSVFGVLGTVEANGTWPVTVIDQTHIEVPVAFVHAYGSGGTAIDLTASANVINPQCAISLSKDGGYRWGNPLVRALGQQQRQQRSRASVKSMGLSGPMGCRWRIDISDQVYAGFLKATQAVDPRDIGD